jgi:hypothetical protein
MSEFEGDFNPNENENERERALIEIQEAIPELGFEETEEMRELRQVLIQNSILPIETGLEWRVLAEALINGKATELEKRRATLGMGLSQAFVFHERGEKDAFIEELRALEDLAGSLKQFNLLERFDDLFSSED